MMTVILYALTACFALKLIWNLTVPYGLARRQLKSGGRNPSGITLMPLVEIVLLLLVIGSATLSTGSSWMHNPKTVAIGGCIAIIISYAHLAIMGMLVGWIVSRGKTGK